VTDHELRVQIHAILDAHDDALGAIRTAQQAREDAHDAHRRAFTAHNDALVSAITANRAALRLLNRVRDEGIKGEPSA
jgi:hypothetical protein